MTSLVALAAFTVSVVPTYSTPIDSSPDRMVMTVQNRNTDLSRLKGKTRDQVIGAVGQPLFVYHNLVVEIWQYSVNGRGFSVCFQEGRVTECDWRGLGGSAGIGLFIPVQDGASGSGSNR